GARPPGAAGGGGGGAGAYAHDTRRSGSPQPLCYNALHMRRAHSCRWWCSMLAVALSLTWVSPLHALLFTLSPRDRDEAVRAGRRSITDESWGREWRVD